MIASAAVTETLPVGEAPQGSRPEQVAEENEEEQRHNVRHVLLAAVADVLHGDFVAKEQDERFHDVGSALAARAPRPPACLRFASRPAADQQNHHQHGRDHHEQHVLGDREVERERADVHRRKLRQVNIIPNGASQTLESARWCRIISRNVEFAALSWAAREAEARKTRS